MESALECLQDRGLSATIIIFFTFGLRGLAASHLQKKWKDISSKALQKEHFLSVNIRFISKKTDC